MNNDKDSAENATILKTKYLMFLENIGRFSNCTVEFCGRDGWNLAVHS